MVLKDVESKTLYSNGLKLKRITLDSKKAHRIEKKEKKEKRKEKKETKREKSHKHSIKATDNHHKLIFLPSKKVSDESDSLEKSGLTDELEEPQKHLGYLSDGSQNSKKRIRDDSPPAVESLIKGLYLFLSRHSRRRSC